MDTHGATPAHRGAVTRTAYQDVRESPEFAALRRRFRRFVFPMTGLFLVWYFTYVLLADYAHGFMSTPVVGNVNVGLLLGLGQFVSTFAITTAYVRWADRHFDPEADELRQRVERVLDGGGEGGVLR
ncbi:DUF485 domain-containing protein [Kineococcus glutinatus]